MKFCTKCGEVYPSDVSTCNVDGAVLEMWTRTLFEAKEDPQGHDMLTRQSRHTDGDDGDDDAEVTNVEVMPYEDPPLPLTTKVSSSDIVGNEALGPKNGSTPSANTSVIDVRDPVTLAEFDVNSKVAAIASGDELVVYDDEVGGPFTGMLISNRYRLESRIGTGGFGVVFDAYDREQDKRVAVKVLSPALSEDKRALMRFRREAIAVSRLQHPGIVSISDFGIEDEGVSYIVMEFLPGRDVAALLEDERFLSARRAATLVMQCAEALRAAHDEGVLHRDLKPANIFVIQNKDLVERIKIIDFGIAKDRSSNPRMKDITAASKVVGTPFYMSPEQASGVELDGRADVYSLGVILYELLTGERPFEGPSVYDILVAHGQAKRVKPSKIRDELRGESELDAIVLRAISALREDRYQSMDAFAEALRNYLEDATGHSSASSLQFRSMPEGIRPSRIAKRELPLGPRKYSEPPLQAQKPFPKWAFAAAALVLISGVAYLVSHDSGETEAVPQPEVAQPLEAQAPSAVTYAGRPKVAPTLDAGIADAQPGAPDGPLAKSGEAAPTGEATASSAQDEPESADAARARRAERRERNRRRRENEAATSPPGNPEEDSKPDRATKPNAPIKERGIEEW